MLQGEGLWAEGRGEEGYRMRVCGQRGGVRKGCITGRGSVGRGVGRGGVQGEGLWAEGRGEEGYGVRVCEQRGGVRMGCVTGQGSVGRGVG